MIIKYFRQKYVLMMGVAFFSFILFYSSLKYFGDIVWYFNEESKKSEALKETFKTFKNIFSQDDGLPQSLNAGGLNLSVKYSMNDTLTLYIKKILKKYRSDFSSVVVIDNKTGHILSAVGYRREGNHFDRTFPFSGTHPSASLIKIITASDLLENTSITGETEFLYRGKSTTLYKYQLMDKSKRWTRKQSFEKAFAKSNNVIFGKAAIEYLSDKGLLKMANLFGFNKDLMQEISVSQSIFKAPDTKYNLAEFATGFNRVTTMSPLHGAILSSVVANKGQLNYPKLILEIKKEDGEILWQNTKGPSKVLKEKTALRLRKMMELTVKKGTARKSFRGPSHSLQKKIKIGGKTGTITGGTPFGKRDWFTGYAISEDGPHNEGISICVMNINVKKWYVKSAYLAKSIIEYYFKNIAPRNG